MVAALVPPPQFASVRLDSFVPDPAFPSQRDAVDAVRAFVERTGGARGRFVRRKRRGSGLYLDGGFGVGKTHLLAAAWHAFDGPKVFGTFIEFTSIVGALGYAAAAATFRGLGLVCIDEFELDDPGDTLIMSRLLGELVAAGTSVIATSNTPPNALGDGRFAASDFSREIHALASVFAIVRIDGTDFRARHTVPFHEGLTPVEFQETVDSWSARGAQVALDDFAVALRHLGQIHPVRFEKLAQMVDVVAWRHVDMVANHNDGLRLVAFIDRLYDAGRPMLLEGVSLAGLFSPDLLASGYAKKYLRALSRLGALTQRALVSP